MRLYVNSVPALGQLYYLNGTSIGEQGQVGQGVEIEVPFESSLQSYALRYRPPLDKNSLT
jgi:hypothetical protein